MGQQPQDRNITEQWLHFFAGTPKRFLWTCFGLFVAFAMVRPDDAAIMLSNVIYVFVVAFGPVAGPLLTLAIAIGGIWLIIRGIFPRKGGNNH